MIAKRLWAAWMAALLCLAASAGGQAPQPPSEPDDNADALLAEADEDMVSLNLSGVTLKAVVLYISDVTGKPVLLPSGFPGDRRLEVVTGRRAKAPAHRAMAVIAAALRNAGFVLAESEEYIRILPEGRMDGTPLADEAKPPPLADAAFLTTLVDVKHVEAGKLVSALDAVKSRSANVRVYPEGNKLIIQEYASHLPELMRLVEELDVPADRTVREIHHLRHRSVEGLQGVLNAYAASRVKGADPVSQKRLQGFSLLPYPANNSFVLLGHPDDVANMREMIETLDVESTEEARRFHTYTVSHRDAEEMVGILTKALAAETAAVGREHAGPPPAVLADKTNNAVLVISTPDRYASLLPLMQQLDKPKAQVMIEAALVELSTERYMDLGFELASVDAPGEGLRVVGASHFGMSTIADGVRTPIPPSRGGAMLGLFKDSALNMPVLLRLSAQDEGVSFLAAPQLMTSDNRPASVEIAEQREYQRSVVSPEGRTSEVTFGGYHKASILLNITPHINEDGKVRLEIRQTTEQFLPSTEGQAGTLTNKITRDTQTEVIVPDNETVVIAGLTRNAKTETVSKVPLLGDLPVVGYLFRRTETSNQQRNLCVFITPRVIRTEADMAGETARHKEELRSLSAESVVGMDERDFEKVTGGRLSPLPQKLTD